MIEARRLTKSFSYAVRAGGHGLLRRRTRADIAAVRDISFRIDAGECVGVLGPNGAGKTTILKLLAGLLHPTSGDVTVLGHEPCRRDREFLRAIALVAGNRQTIAWDLPPLDTFDLNRAIYGVPRDEYRRRLDELASLLGIEHVMRKPARQLSLGERMKCELAGSLLHRPRLLFLDEPTLGLDVTMQVTVRRFLRGYAATHGATLLLTSHYMADVDALCPRVIAVDGGGLVYDGTLRALVRTTSDVKRIEVTLADRPRHVATDLGLSPADGDARRLVGEVTRRRLPALVRRVLTELQPVDLSIQDPPLEAVFQRLFTPTSPEQARYEQGSALRNA